MRYKIIYTSDVHGQLLASDYATKQKAHQGLSRLFTYLKSLKAPYLLLDNGDFLQGSVLLDYHRKFGDDLPHPIETAYNHMGYDTINLGNHDFNYGFDYMKGITEKLNGDIICANMVGEDSQPIFTPYKIKTLKNGFKIGLIGIVTQYIPKWEKPKHIQHLHFLDAYDTALKYVDILKDTVDYLVVLYHGGFERDLKTHQAIGRDTKENLGYKIAHIEGLDLLLTGHQHLPTNLTMPKGTLVLQTNANVKNFGEVTLDIKTETKGFSFSHDAKLIDNTMAEDETMVKILKPLEDKTQTWLDEPIGSTLLPMKITNPLTARQIKHPLFEWINRMQLELTHADISAASLPNHAPGFNQTIYLRDVAANFVYPNTIDVLKITGKQLKAALERTAEYFTLKAGEIAIDDSFLHPKEEHYNYDVFDGITYSFNLKSPKGQRVSNLHYNDAPIRDNQVFTIALNNYRAQGGGDYIMYQEAELVKSYDQSLFDLAVETLQNQKVIQFKPKDNFDIIT